MDRTFSTTEVSRLWNVSESTIKRWADQGDLPCLKTPGGHRKFRLDDLVAFQKRNGFASTGGLEPALPPNTGLVVDPVPLGKAAVSTSVFSQQLEAAVTRRNEQELQELYFMAAIQGDEGQAREIVQRAYLRGYAPMELKEQVLKPVLHRIGHLWQRGEISVLEEHLASAVTIAATSRLHLQTPNKSGNGRVAVCGCPEGDFHDIPLRWLSQALESEGWKVVVTGANTPIFSFSEAIRKFQPALLCISATIVSHLERLRRDYAECWPTAKQIGTRIIIGGAAFAAEDVRAQFPHDFYGRDLVEFTDYLQTEFPARPPVAKLAR